MNFVFLNQYYPPDAAPTGIMLARVVQEMTKAGHEVTVICAKGGYASRDANDQESGNVDEHGGDGVNVLRVGATSFGRGTFLGKLVDYVSFYLGVVWALARLSQQPDKIVALTTPPYLSILARIFSKLHGIDFSPYFFQAAWLWSCSLGHGSLSGCDGGSRYAEIQWPTAQATRGFDTLGFWWAALQHGAFTRSRYGKTSRQLSGARGNKPLGASVEWF
jgi:hypothetical protein